MQRILISGSEGLVASGLIPALEARGVEVCRFDLLGRENSIEQGDIREAAAVRRAMRGCSGVIHLAAVSRVVWGQNDPDLCWETNVEGTKNVLKAAAVSEPKPWVVFASSREVYGEPAGCPVREHDELRPLNIYGRSKLAGERAVHDARQHGLRTAVVRLSNVYGGIDDHVDRVIPAFARAAVEGKALRVDGRDHTFDFTHLDDTVRGIIALCDRLENGAKNLPPIHLLTGRPTTLGELARLTVDTAQSASIIHEAPPRNYDVATFWGDPSRAHKWLDWRAEITLEEGVFRLIQDFERALKHTPEKQKQSPLERSGV